MPTPNHPALPQCSQFAAHPARYLFAGWLNEILMQQSLEHRSDAAHRLKGMLSAYMEMDVISGDHYRAMSDELNAFTFGATV